MIYKLYYKSIIAFFSFFLLLSPFFCLAQNINNEFNTLNAIGMVLNNGDKTALEGAVVHLINEVDKTQQILETPTNGNFAFPLQPNMSYKLYAQKGEHLSDPSYLDTNDEGIKKIQSFILIVPTQKIPKQLPHLTKQEETSVVPAILTSQSKADALLAIQSITELSFNILLGTYTQRILTTSSFLEKVKDKLKIEESENGEFRYLVGSFPSYKSANDYQDKLQQLGYQKTEIVGYWQDKPLDVPVEQIVAYVQKLSNNN